MRIVSLLPSATEILCELGLADQIVGVTHECDFPPAMRALPKVTNTLIPTDVSSGEIDQLVRERMGEQSALYTLDMDMLERLRPDLIVTQALCDVCAVAEAEVRSAACALPSGPRVLNLEPETLDEVLACIIDVGVATGIEPHARDVVGRLRERVDAVVRRAAVVQAPPRVALLEWIDPPFSTGHWNPELVRLAGGIDGLGREGEKSVTLHWQDVVTYDPEVVLLSCCGFTAERTVEETGILARVPGWEDVAAVRAGRVYVTDGSSYFSRPGPRLVDSLELMAHVVDPAIHPLPAWVMPPIQLAQGVAFSSPEASGSGGRGSRGGSGGGSSRNGYGGP